MGATPPQGPSGLGAPSPRFLFFSWKMLHFRETVFIALSVGKVEAHNTLQGGNILDRLRIRQNVERVGIGNGSSRASILDSDGLLGRVGEAKALLADSYADVSHMRS